MTRRVSTPEVVVLALLALVVWDVTHQVVRGYRPGCDGLAVMTLAAGSLLLAQAIVSLRVMRPLRDRFWPWVLLAQSAAFASGMWLFPGRWIGFAGFLAASFALLLPTRISVPVVAAGTASIVVVFGDRSGVAAGVYEGLTVVAAGAAPWALTRFGDLADDLIASRGAAVRLAVLAERERSAADLESLLGGRLRAVQESGALAEVDPALSTGPIQELVDVARAAMADVRAVARGQRGMSIAVPSESAREPSSPTTVSRPTSRPPRCRRTSTRVSPRSSTRR